MASETSRRIWKNRMNNWKNWKQKPKMDLTPYCNWVMMELSTMILL